MRTCATRYRQMSAQRIECLRIVWTGGMHIVMVIGAK